MPNFQHLFNNIASTIRTHTFVAQHSFKLGRFIGGFKFR